MCQSPFGSHRTRDALRAFAHCPATRYPSGRGSVATLPWPTCPLWQTSTGSARRCHAVGKRCVGASVPAGLDVARLSRPPRPPRRARWHVLADSPPPRHLDNRFLTFGVRGQARCVGASVAESSCRMSAACLIRAWRSRRADALVVRHVLRTRLRLWFQATSRARAHAGM